jgi:hypothetical protein
MSKAHSIRPIDHLVLPTASLEAARARLGALGFTVAPTGVHPFGTINACVYFADGTFLEPLAVGDAALADAAVSAGNVFIARDRLFRLSHGDEGFSALVFGTTDGPFRATSSAPTARATPLPSSWPSPRPATPATPSSSPASASMCPKSIAPRSRRMRTARRG